MPGLVDMAGMYRKNFNGDLPQCDWRDFGVEPHAVVLVSLNPVN